MSNNNINWYPGHMAKTRREIEQDLKLIDVVIELLDARIPYSSRNPEIKKLTNNKKKIIILNKMDLADPSKTKRWQEYYSKENVCLSLDCNSGKGIDKLNKEIDKLVEEDKAKAAARGRINKTTRVMILGIPNVGKSTLINRIAKKNTLETANRPGVTRQKQWIRIGKNQELLDTPGVLWPKFESEDVSLNLAFTGTIKNEILQSTEIAYELLKVLFANYKNELFARFKIEETEWNEIKDNHNPLYELMKLMAKKRGAVLSGGKIDDERISNIILEEFRSGKIGKITLEDVK